MVSDERVEMLRFWRGAYKVPLGKPLVADLFHAAMNIYRAVYQLRLPRAKYTMIGRIADIHQNALAGC